MIFIPLPFVVSLILIIVLMQMVRRSREGVRQNPFFVTLVAAHAVQSVLIGLRWGYGIRAIMPAQALLATALASLAWIGFRSLMQDASLFGWRQIWPHLLPTMLVALLMIVWPDGLGPAITLTFLSYGLALLWLSRRGPDILVSSRLDGAVLSFRSLRITAAALIASPIIDIIISLDVEWTGGINAGAVVAVANVIALIIFGGAASVVGTSETSDIAAETAPPPADSRARSSEENGAVMEAIDALMRSKQLYKDTELNLARLARRLNLPARHVSQAVNRTHGVSVSQYVNDYRVREACRLLDDTSEPIIQVALESGFLTKSNFNREFARVTGKTPTEWRRRRCEAAVEMA